MASVASEFGTRTQAGAEPIRRHPAFPGLVGLWIGSLCALGMFALPDGTAGRLAALSGIGRYVPAGSLPLGDAGNGALALAVAVLGGLAAYALARLLTRSHARTRYTDHEGWEATSYEDDPAPQEGIPQALAANQQNTPEELRSMFKVILQEPESDSPQDVVDEAHPLVFSPPSMAHGEPAGDRPDGDPTPPALQEDIGAIGQAPSLADLDMVKLAEGLSRAVEPRSRDYPAGTIEVATPSAPPPTADPAPSFHLPNAFAHPAAGTAAPDLNVADAGSRQEVQESPGPTSEAGADIPHAGSEPEASARNGDRDTPDDPRDDPMHAAVDPQEPGPETSEPAPDELAQGEPPAGEPASPYWAIRRSLDPSRPGDPENENFVDEEEDATGEDQYTHEDEDDVLDLSTAFFSFPGRTATPGGDRSGSAGPGTDPDPAGRNANGLWGRSGASGEEGEEAYGSLLKHRQPRRRRLQALSRNISEAHRPVWPIEEGGTEEGRHALRAALRDRRHLDGEV